MPLHPRVRVAHIDDIPPGTTRIVALEGERVLLANVDGDLYAVRDECTHDGAPLSEGDVEGTTVVCPWHFSRFCLRTGAVLDSPALDPVQTHRPEVVDGDVYLSRAA